MVVFKNHLAGRCPQRPETVYAQMFQTIRLSSYSIKHFQIVIETNFFICYNLIINNKQIN